MKKILLLIAMVTLCGTTIFANGVLFSKVEIGSYLILQETSVNVTIEGQVASTVARGTYVNDLRDSLSVKFAFPLPEGASATALRYQINGVWFEASFAPVPQDTTTVTDPGQDDYKLRQYLGANPLFYEIEQAFRIDSTMVIELSYVELLPYKFGNVTYRFPNDYGSIQESPLHSMELSLVLNSDRTIDDIALLSHQEESISNNGKTASLTFKATEVMANADILVQYQLNSNELGLFALSTFVPDSLQMDDYGGGFFSFIAEPDASENSQVISKVFSLIIDCSGSMSGEKMVQARDAARFIIENLNEGDKFNIIAFDSKISSFSNSHKEYTIANREEAIDYIQSLNAGGMTNISGAFDIAIPQFKFADDQTANIIIFFTDGEQTEGITDTDLLINHINNLVVHSEKQIALFTFGIGSYVNERLLTSIATSNSGMVEFLKDEDLESVITDFYLMIQYPVLLNTKITYSPDVLTEIYPTLLPNLYKGKQLLVVGRYNTPGDIQTILSGNAYNNNVSYDYVLQLSDTFETNKQFLTKLWARGKIDFLTEQYYLNMHNPALRDSIKEEVIDVSLTYGVMSIFTSFQGSNPDDNNDPVRGGIITFIEYERLGLTSPSELSNKYIAVEALYPNPVTSHFILKLASRAAANGMITLELMDSRGLSVHTREEQITPNAQYRFIFDVQQLNLKSGVYLLVIRFKDTSVTCRVVVR